jgi:hypothetical protein
MHSEGERKRSGCPLLPLSKQILRWFFVLRRCSGEQTQAKSSIAPANPDQDKVGISRTTLPYQWRGPIRASRGRYRKSQMSS